MSLDKVYRKIHRLVSDNEDRDISQKEMSERIGCSLDTYSAHYRGYNKPKAAIQLLELLNMLDDDQIVKAVRTYQEKE
ncbi:MAG: hypothetical protein ACWGHH_00040 [Sulfurovaceae bacterium]